LSKKKIDGTIVCRCRDGFGEMTVADNGRVRSLYFGDGIVQSCINLDRPSDLLMDCCQAMLTPLVFMDRPESVLLIGLGGGTMANFLLRHLPFCTVDAVEVSPEVIRLAHDYFQVPREDKRLSIFQDDGREFVRKREASGRRYDLILLDAFDDGGPASVLMEKDFFTFCRRLLKKNGMCSINLWTRPRDNFSAIYEMIGDVFGGNAGKLSLEESYQNAVVLACEDISAFMAFTAYRPGARHLQRSWGVNFPKYLMNLRWKVPD